ncbi:MAG: hypothetical protein ACFCVG_08810 [Kineosporiaceae bacterium]
MRAPGTPGPGGRGAAPVRDEQGSVSAFVLVVAAGLLLVVGLVVDGGLLLRTLQQADAVAAEAARQAGQRIDAPASVRGGPPRAEVAAATAAGQAHLAAAGYRGTVTVVGGTRIRVTATTTRPTLILGLAGRPSITVTGQAEARLTRGLATPQ